MPKHFLGQSYIRLKKECVRKGVLFEDPEFPANNKSVFFSKVDSEIVWKRPMELCRMPHLVVEGVGCEDLIQGELGNAWFITACATLALEPKLWKVVVPNYKEQEWDQSNKYAGIFHFTFFRYGAWSEVVIDDRLPTKNDNLLFCHSISRNEFWSALLEKAYAKLYGDYESLTYGYVADALVDMTGGVSEKLVVSELELDKPENKVELLNKLLRANQQKAFIVCRIECSPERKHEETNEGLLLGRGYHVTQIKVVTVNQTMQDELGSDKLKLLRIFNPWGVSTWSGPWSDLSPEWHIAHPREWEKLGVTFTQEGEFWISYDDFLRNFTNIDICHFVNTSLFSLDKTWVETTIRSRWTLDKLSDRDYHSFSFLRNPQIMFDVVSPEDDILVSLEQHDVSAGRIFYGDKLNTIGFHIMKVEENRKYRVHRLGERVFKSTYLRSRSVFGSCLLQRGRYIVLPTLKESGHSGDFLLRMYTTKSARCRELYKDGPSHICPCLGRFSMVTTITVIGAKGIQLPPAVKGDCNPLVVIKCEGQKVKSSPCLNTFTPVWNVKATFYRKSPSHPIKVQIWNYYVMLNVFIGETDVTEQGYEEGVVKEYELWERNKRGVIKCPGWLKVHVISSCDINSL